MIQETGHARNTIRKVIRGEFSGYQERSVQPYPVLAPFMEIIDNWLETLHGSRRENIRSSFKDACHIRKIVAVNGSRLFFRELLPTMDVDFVRTGQSTVIPFPFKYLLENRDFEKLD